MDVYDCDVIQFWEKCMFTHMFTPLATVLPEEFCFVLLWSCWCLHILTEVHRLCCGACWSSLWGSIQTHQGYSYWLCAPSSFQWWHLLCCGAHTPLAAVLPEITCIAKDHRQQSQQDHAGNMQDIGAELLINAPKVGIPASFPHLLGRER